jgi:hypothetical protein
MIPKSGVPLSDKIMRRKGRRSAERRMPTMSAQQRQTSPLAMTIRRPPSARLRATLGGAPAFRRFTAALATGCHPDGSAPEPGFLKGTAYRSFARPPHKAFELSTLRADRSFCRPTGAPGPPGSGSHPSARGHRIPLRFPKVPSRKAPLVSGIPSCNLFEDDRQDLSQSLTGLVTTESPAPGAARPDIGGARSRGPARAGR